MLKRLARVLPIVALCLAAAGAALGQGPVRVASKIDTEGALLGSMMIALLEQQGIETIDRLRLGPTNIVRTALLAGEIDLYPEYTGNGAFFYGLDRDPSWRDAAAGYARIKALDAATHRLIWLAPAPADNSWIIAIRRDLAERNGLATMADLARWVSQGGEVLLAASAEFIESPAALPAFEAAYGFHLSGEQLLILAGGNTTTTLRAAAEGISGVNAAMAYGTDGAIAVLRMVALADPRGAEIVYAPAPVVRQAVLDAHPQIAATLAPAFATLDATTLRQLNARIAVAGEDAATVARDYLRIKGLLR